MLKGLAVALLALYCLILIVLSLVADYAGGIWAVSGVTGAVALGAAGFLFLLRVRVFASALLIVGGVLAGGAVGIFGGWGQTPSGFWGSGAGLYVFGVIFFGGIAICTGLVLTSQALIERGDRQRVASRAQQRREQ